MKLINKKHLLASYIKSKNYHYNCIPSFINIITEPFDLLALWVGIGATLPFFLIFSILRLVLKIIPIGIFFGTLKRYLKKIKKKEKIMLTKLFEKLVILIFIAFAIIVLFKLVIPAVFALSSIISVILAGIVSIIIVFAVISLSYFFFKRS